MGFRRLQRKLTGLLNRTKEVQERRSEPKYTVDALGTRELWWMDRLLARYLDPGTDLSEEQELALGALLARADERDRPTRSAKFEPRGRRAAPRSAL